MVRNYRDKLKQVMNHHPTIEIGLAQEMQQTKGRLDALEQDLTDHFTFRAKF